MSVNIRMEKKMWYIYTMQFYPVVKKNGIMNFEEKLPEIIVKQNKPVLERQLPHSKYGFTLYLYFIYVCRA